MPKARNFELACNQQYMQGKIRGFMHLDNGQESIPGLIDYAIKNEDKKYSYYREHCHAIASGVDPKLVLAELCMKETGLCKGAGGSMHIFDKPRYVHPDAIDTDYNARPPPYFAQVNHGLYQLYISVRSM